MIPGIKYNPATETSRRPTPEKFDHLRRWVEPVKRDIRITNITEMTNINEQLEQNAELYVSNIISRVIAQLIGKYGDGFVTLEATADGHLMVQSEREAKIITSAKIDFSGSGDNTIVTGQAGKQVKLASLVLTVGGETNLTLKAGATAITGPMDFGGTDEPRGIVDTHGYCALELAVGQSFVINSSAAVQVSGYVTGYID
jgi:hypothetical protein